MLRPFWGSALSLLVITSVLCPAQQTGSAVKAAAPNVKECSYTALNDNCTIVVDRTNPVTPPTIYMKRNAVVRVTMKDPYLLEDLTLDWKSTSTVLPPEAFQVLFNAFSPNVGKLTIAEVAQGKGPFSIAASADIAQKQADIEKLIESIDPLTLAANAVSQIKAALQPPNIGAPPAPPWSCTDAACINDWKKPIVDCLKTATKKYRDVATLREIHDRLAHVDEEIAQKKRLAEIANNDDTLTDMALLEDIQAQLKSEVKALPDAVPSLRTLEVGVDSLTPATGAITGNDQIRDTGDKQAYHLQTWVLDYVNRLAPAAQRAAADKLQSQGGAALSGINSASSKQPIVTLTVQFQDSQRVEASAGLMVPFRPNHSYAAAAQGSGGAVTGNVVQQTNTYVVVPMAFANILTKEWMTGNRRSAIFGTGGIGYNPASTTVEFGLGITYSYRSIEVGGLLDIGRDSKLEGGFTANQPLGTGTVPNPITGTHWIFRPATAVSLRIPLGGSSGSN
ncbi:MAG TPA: hypothetical protein VKW78_23075 [Terriglobales bacterium]|nr:hypothetical protein [Terriglobales bacterium]